MTFSKFQTSLKLFNIYFRSTASIRRLITTFLPLCVLALGFVLPELITVGPNSAQPYVFLLIATICSANYRAAMEGSQSLGLDLYSCTTVVTKGRLYFIKAFSALLFITLILFISSLPILFISFSSEYTFSNAVAIGFGYFVSSLIMFFIINAIYILLSFILTGPFVNLTGTIVFILVPLINIYGVKDSTGLVTKTELKKYSHKRSVEFTAVDPDTGREIKNWKPGIKPNNKFKYTKWIDSYLLTQVIYKKISGNDPKVYVPHNSPKKVLWINSKVKEIFEKEFSTTEGTELKKIFEAILDKQTKVDSISTLNKVGDMYAATDISDMKTVLKDNSLMTDAEVTEIKDLYKGIASATNQDNFAFDSTKFLFIVSAYVSNYHAELWKGLEDMNKDTVESMFYKTWSTGYESKVKNAIEYKESKMPLYLIWVWLAFITAIFAISYKKFMRKDIAEVVY